MTYTVVSVWRKSLDQAYPLEVEAESWDEARTRAQVQACEDLGILYDRKDPPLLIAGVIEGRVEVLH